MRSVHNWLNQLTTQAGISISLNTIEQYGRTLSYLCRWIESNRPYPDLSIDDNISLLSRHDIVNWIQTMKVTGAESHNTLHSREACVKQFLDWLTTIDGGRVREKEDSPWGRNGDLNYVVKGPNARSPKFITADMVILILKEMHNECERCMFHTQYDTGLRISELINLRVSQLPQEHQYDPSHEFIPLYVNGIKGRGGQSKERITLISRAVLKRIRRYHNTLEYKMATDWNINDPDKPVFLTSNQRAWSARNAAKQFKNSVRRSNVPDAFRSHWMRHGTAFSILRSDIGKTYEDRMLTIQKMLGHSNLKITEIYTQVSPALLTKLTKSGNELDRLGEAEHIRTETYLGQLQHKEKRGHRG
ncbi:MAG: tyrosine-type recombinase/integrase [Methylotenera sp.]|nr:tyrosine-type recombinase/integrase [Methylotenera sp.]